MRWQRVLVSEGTGTRFWNPPCRECRGAAGPQLQLSRGPQPGCDRTPLHPPMQSGTFAQPLVVAGLLGQVRKEMPQAGAGIAEPSGLGDEAGNGLHHRHCDQLTPSAGRRSSHGVRSRGRPTLSSHNDIGHPRPVRAANPSELISRRRPPCSGRRSATSGRRPAWSSHTAGRPRSRRPGSGSADEP